MTDPARPVLVAVAWPYASGPRHIGHVAGFGVPADIYARYHRARGHRVLMVSGTDEHGTPITFGADAEGVQPREYADRYNRVIVEDLRALGLSYDLFTRTTTANHYRVVQDLFLQLVEHGAIRKGPAIGAFSSVTGRNLPDRYIEGTCPICGYPSARGDQCDNCGNQLDPTDLIDPRSRTDGQPPVFRETEHWFLDLPQFQDRLIEWVERNEHWRPNVRAFSANYLKELRPRSVTRDLDWGVPIPLEGEDIESKRIYVWFDAVIGYLSASIEWAASVGTPDAWRDWWQNPDAWHAYFMGKDNIVFHSVMWPAILLGYDDGPLTAGGGPLRLPDDIVSSEFLTMEGRKFSSSRGIAIYVRDFLSRYDPDPLRYYLTVAGPENQDTDFTWSEFVRRTNGELVGTWGNLVHRTLTNSHRNFGGVPSPGELTEQDQAVMAEVRAGFDVVGGSIEKGRFRAACAEAMRLAARVNGYLAEVEPWKLMAADRERAGTALYVALRCISDLKVLFMPFLPFSSQRLHELLGGSGTIASQPEIREGQQQGDGADLVITGDHRAAAWQPTDLAPGTPLPRPEPLFRKLDEAIVDEELARMGGAAEG